MSGQAALFAAPDTSNLWMARRVNATPADAGYHFFSLVFSLGGPKRRAVYTSLCGLQSKDWQSWAHPETYWHSVRQLRVKHVPRCPACATHAPEVDALLVMQGFE